MFLLHLRYSPTENTSVDFCSVQPFEAQLIAIRRSLDWRRNILFIELAESMELLQMKNWKNNLDFKFGGFQMALLESLQ